MSRSQRSKQFWIVLERAGGWLLAIVWVAPLVYTFWAALRPRASATSLSLADGFTLANLITVWNSAPFDRYYFNTFVMVSTLLVVELIIGVMAAYAFARFDFPFKRLLFALVLVQLMIMPEVLISENFVIVSRLGFADTITGIWLPYAASAFAIFLLRQQFLTIPEELDEAAEVEGAGRLRKLRLIYVPLAKPTMVAFGLVSVSFHWNSFLWPVVITNSVEARPLTVGLQVFVASETGVQWSLLSAAAVLVVAPLVIGFLLFQKQFVESFMRAGIR